MHTIFLFFLSFFARLIITRHKPYIIGVTGTVGKTTITTHIAHFLARELGSSNVGYSIYHYNGEYGLPLTIIWAKSPGKNPFLWIWIFILALWRLVRPYPRYFVLEYGIDHPGEMDALLSIAKPNIAILTRVEPNHLEQFWSLENYRKHKIKLIEASEVAIIHESLRQYIERDALYYSLWALSDIDASNIEIQISGTEATIHYHHNEYPIRLPAIGAFQIENLLPLYPIADLLNIDLSHIAQYASHSAPESGRSSILAWVSGTTIIDWTYNGWYLSLHEWVTSMRSFMHSHSIVFFLGDMRELGQSSRDIHEKLAHEISEVIPHDARVSFYLVGPMMRDYVAPILSSKFHVITSLSSRELGQQIAIEIGKNKQDTIIYAKWSQNTIFIEEGLKFLLKNTEDISKLPRQSSHWMYKKDIFFKSLEQ